MPTTLRAGHAGDSTVAHWANEQEYVIKFTHQPTGHSVEFPATLQSFSDTHSPSFTKQYGASTMDPTIILSSTDRKLNFSFTVLNSSIDEARHNRQCVNLLIQMLYPLLDDEGAIIASPYITVEVMNLVNSAIDSEGILCIISNIDYSMNLDSGILSDNEGIPSLNYSGKEIYPISLDINIDATAVLERDADSNTFLPNTYPSYGGR